MGFRRNELSSMRARARREFEIGKFLGCSGALSRLYLYLCWNSTCGGCGHERDGRCIGRTSRAYQSRSSRDIYLAEVQYPCTGVPSHHMSSTRVHPRSLQGCLSRYTGPPVRRAKLSRAKPSQAERCSWLLARGPPCLQVYRFLLQHVDDIAPHQQLNSRLDVKYVPTQIKGRGIEISPRFCLSSFL